VIGLLDLPLWFGHGPASLFTRRYWVRKPEFIIPARHWEYAPLAAAGLL
jgi:hypothetical protein